MSTQRQGVRVQPRFLADARDIGRSLWVCGMKPCHTYTTAWILFWIRGVIGGAAFLVGALVFGDSIQDPEYLGCGLLGIMMSGVGGAVFAYHVWLDLRAMRRFGSLAKAFLAAQIAACWEKPRTYPGGWAQMQLDIASVRAHYRQRETT